MTDNRMQRNAKPQYTSYDMREESTMTDNNTNSKMRKHIQTQAGSVMQQTYEASVAAGATGVAIEAATGTAIGGAIATTAAGGLLVTAAPVAVGLAAAYAVGSFFSSLFDD